MPKRNKLRRTARRNVRASFQPQLNAIDQAQLSTQQDFLGALQGARAAHAGAQRELGRIPEFPLADISGELQGQLAGLTSMLGGSPGVPNYGGEPVPEYQGFPGEETQAGQNAFGAIGGGFQGILSTMAGRQAQYGQSAMRENTLAGRYARENLTQDLMDALQGYDLQRTQVAGQMPMYIRQEMERLREQQATEESEAAFAQLVQDLIGNRLSRGGGRGAGGGGGGGGGRGPQFSEFTRRKFTDTGPGVPSVPSTPSSPTSRPSSNRRKWTTEPVATRPVSREGEDPNLAEWLRYAFFPEVDQPYEEPEAMYPEQSPYHDPWDWFRYMFFPETG